MDVPCLQARLGHERSAAGVAGIPMDVSSSHGKEQV